MKKKNSKKKCIPCAKAEFAIMEQAHVGSGEAYIFFFTLYVCVYIYILSTCVFNDNSNVNKN